MVLIRKYKYYFYRKCSKMMLLNVLFYQFIKVDLLEYLNMSLSISVIVNIIETC